MVLQDIKTISDKCTNYNILTLTTVEVSISYVSCFHSLKNFISDTVHLPIYYLNYCMLTFLTLLMLKEREIKNMKSLKTVLGGKE